MKDYLLKGYAIRRPVDAAEINEIRECLHELEQRLDNFEFVTDTQGGELYNALIDIVSKKSIGAKQQRKPIGFQLPSDKKEKRVSQEKFYLI